MDADNGGPENPQHGEPFAHNFAVGCLTFVGDYREGRNGKAQVVRDLVGALEGLRGQVQGDPGIELDRTLGVYLGMLDDFDRERGAAVQEGVEAGQDFGRHEGDEGRAG